MADATRTATRPASQEAAENSTAAKPVATFRSGSVSVAVFPGDSVSLRRSYRTKAGAWKHTSTLWRRDVAHAIKALSECLVSSAEESPEDPAEE
jgi:hypothetical protein